MPRSDRADREATAPSARNAPARLFNPENQYILGGSTLARLLLSRRGMSTKSTAFKLLWVGACLFGAIAVFFLWDEHQAHILVALPYLFLLACPFMHLFMHHGHRHGHGASGSDG